MRAPVRKRRPGPPRRGPLRDQKYMDWLKTKRCAVCFQVGCDPAHTVNNGMSSKGPDSSCVPLCRKHHEEYDAGRREFEFNNSIDMKAEAEQWYSEYREEQLG